MNNNIPVTLTHDEAHQIIQALESRKEESFRGLNADKHYADTKSAQEKLYTAQTTARLNNIKTPTELQRTEAKKAASKLFEAFVWQDTQEGAEYWSEVHDKLERISEGRF